MTRSTFTSETVLVVPLCEDETIQEVHPTTCVLSLRSIAVELNSALKWEISTGRLPNLYSIRNALYQMEITFPGVAEPGKIMESGNGPQDWYVIPAETGYVYVSLSKRLELLYQHILFSRVALDPGRSLVWNIAGGDPVDYAHVRLF